MMLDKSRKNIPVITIDGPSGVGKGTIAQLLSARLGFHLLDSGATFRVLALAAQDAGVALDDEAALAALVCDLQVTFEPSKDGEPPFVVLNGQDVSVRVRSEAVGKAASKIAVFPKVRQALLTLQRSFKKAPGLVADGRDMGTTVFKEAAFKFFLIASVRARALRRFKQLRNAGIDAKIADLEIALEKRDKLDSERKASPLCAAQDAVTIDTSNLSIDEVLGVILKWVSVTWGNDLVDLKS